MTRPICEIEILADFCGHICPGWFPIDCRVALVAIDIHTGLACDDDLIIGEEVYLRDVARLYIAAVLGERYTSA